MDVTLLTTCRNCASTAVLKAAAHKEGYSVKIETVLRSDRRTKALSEAKIGLPGLIREDGGVSGDAKNWVGGKKKRTKVTHPVDEVIEDASGDNT